VTDNSEGAKEDDDEQDADDGEHPQEAFFGHFVVSRGFDGAETALFFGEIFVFGAAGAADLAALIFAEGGFGDDSAAIGTGDALGFVGFLIELMAGIAPVASAVAEPTVAIQVFAALAADFGFGGFLDALHDGIAADIVGGCSFYGCDFDRCDISFSRDLGRRRISRKTSAGTADFRGIGSNNAATIRTYEFGRHDLTLLGIRCHIVRRVPGEVTCRDTCRQIDGCGVVCGIN
jgi:hypothetical protein